MRLVVLGGESVGTAILGKKRRVCFFVSDFGKIKDKYKKDLIDNNIEWEEHTEFNSQCNCSHEKSWDS
jgi:UDP-N-acetylmuramoylalanine--D-glutamate ligase